MDFLKSAVASAIAKGPLFGYSFDDKLDLEGSIWTLHNGTKREDGSRCSIFSLDVPSNKSRLPLAKNAVRKLRTLRHPGIVRVLDIIETETYIYVATERLTPLRWHVRRRSLNAETIKWGLFTIANTLKFINDEGTSVHGNIRIPSIFTSESGEWRIGGLEILSSMKEDDAVIYTYAGLVPGINRYAPPEVSKGGWDVIKKNPLPATDSYDVGVLIFELFNPESQDPSEIGQTKNIPPTMHQSYKRLLNANPRARLSVSHFLEQGRRAGGFFDTPIIRLTEGVESMGLKTDEEKSELLSGLEEVSEDFPEDFFKMKILPELLNSVEYGGGGPRVFNFVMKIGDKLSEEEYESRLNPVLLRLFASPDRQMRVCLLDNLPHMIDHFSQKTVTDKIFPQVVTGFSDTAPVVREQTVKAVLTLITKLSDRIINGELLKHLAKTANDEQPGIRTNTTICLGKIARNLGPSTRQKILVAAFTRSLRDPFVHGRNAALQALAATADLFSEEDSANKILPAICPSLIDKEKIVRDQANKTLDIYLSRIRKHGSTMPDTVLPPPNTAASNGATPRIGTPQNDTSWAGWAISSFTNKMAGASGEIQPKTAGKPPAALTNPENRPLAVPAHVLSANRPSSAPSMSISGRKTAPPATSGVADTPTNSEQSFGDNTAAADDGDEDVDGAWGAFDADGEGDAFFDALSKRAPSPSGAAAAATAIPFDDGGEPDFAGWLSAQTQAKSKANLPKGFSRPVASSALSSSGKLQTSKGSTAAGSKGIPSRPAPTPRTPSAPKIISTKPKESADDDWGDAWD